MSQARRILDRIERGMKRKKSPQVGDRVWVKGKLTGGQDGLFLVDIAGRNYSFLPQIVKLDAGAEGEPK